MALLEKYGVGPNIQRYVANIWEDQKFFCKQGGFFSTEIDAERGVTQGDVNSPVIFNSIVDAVLRKVQEEEDFGLTEMCFYADDRLLEHTDSDALQRDMDRVVTLFSMFRLKANKDKTKFMVVRGAQVPMAQDAQTYNRVRTGGISRHQWRKEPMTCSRCGVDITRGTMKRHLELVHGVQESAFQCSTAEEGIIEEGISVRMKMDKKFTSCPVDGCLGGACDSFTMF